MAEASADRARGDAPGVLLGRRADDVSAVRRDAAVGDPSQLAGGPGYLTPTWYGSPRLSAPALIEPLFRTGREVVVRCSGR